MTRRGITLEEVENAVSALEKRGDAVTYISVRRELGDRGSMSTIMKHLTQIKERSSEKGSRMADVPEEFRERFEKVILEVWRFLQDRASRDVDEIRKAANMKVEACKSELETLCNAFDEQSRELDNAIRELKNHQEKLNNLESNLIRVEAEKGEVEKLNKSLLARLDDHALVIDRILSKKKKEGEG